MIEFVPIASATRLRRAASSSSRFVWSNTGAGGVMRKTGGSAARAGATELIAVDPAIASASIATVKTVNGERDFLLFIIIPVHLLILQQPRQVRQIRDSGGAD